MKTKKILLCSILLLSLFFSGCAVKKEDNFAIKTLKHTANAPLYLGMAGKKITEGAIIGTLYLGAKGVSMATDNKKENATEKSNNNSTGENIK